MKILCTSMCAMILAVSSLALAMPRIDPLLRPLLNSSSEDTRIITVIALFHDKAMPERVVPHMRSAHGYMQSVMMANAQASQKATLLHLGAMAESRIPLNVETLWLVNGMIVKLPVNQLRQLATDENIATLYANRQAHIIQPYIHGDVSTGSVNEVKYTYGLEKLNIPLIRQKAAQLIGTGVRVGILDTGVDAKHPDLKDRVVGWKDFIKGQKEPFDDHGHGTHVSGTIAGGETSGTSIGVAPGAKILMGKIFSASGSGSWDAILKGMQWMADPDGDPKTNDFPSLVSNSWGGGEPSASENPMDNAMCKAVHSWVTLGILPVFAAGNSGSGEATVNLPGACPEALTVGATDKDDKIASFSSRGPAKWKSGEIIKPTISAPGVAVNSAAPGGGYKTMSGTSMATPHTAGLAALVYQANPGITIEAATKLIIAGAQDLGTPGNDNDYGWGRIDAAKTVKTLLEVMRRNGGN